MNVHDVFVQLGMQNLTIFALCKYVYTHFSLTSQGGNFPSLKKRIQTLSGVRLVYGNQLPSAPVVAVEGEEISFLVTLNYHFNATDVSTFLLILSFCSPVVYHYLSLDNRGYNYW